MKLQRVILCTLILCTLILCTLLAATPASAQPTDEPGISPLVLPTSPPRPPPPTPPTHAPAPPPPPPSHVLQTGLDYPEAEPFVAPRDDVDTGELKSPGVALGLSLGITLGAVGGSIAMLARGIDSHDGGALVGTGLTVGALGLAFGPSAGHFYAGDGRRGLGMGFGRLAAVGGAYGLGMLTVVAAFGGSEGGAIACFVGAIGAGVTAVGLAIWDIAAAPGAARRANERLRERVAGLSLGPMVTDASAGARGYGLQLGGRF